MIVGGRKSSQSRPQDVVFRRIWAKDSPGVPGRTQRAGFGLGAPASCFACKLSHSQPPTVLSLLIFSSLLSLLSPLTFFHLPRSSTTSQAALRQLPPRVRCYFLGGGMAGKHLKPIAWGSAGATPSGDKNASWGLNGWVALTVRTEQKQTCEPPRPESKASLSP